MKYLYQRNNGIITKYEWLGKNIRNGNCYIDLATDIIIDESEILLLGKVNEDITELIEKGDLVEIEYESGIIDIIYIYNNQKLKKFKSQLAQKYFTIYSILTKEEYNKRKFEV